MEETKFIENFDLSNSNKKKKKRKHRKRIITEERNGIILNENNTSKENINGREIIFHIGENGDSEHQRINKSLVEELNEKNSAAYSSNHDFSLISIKDNNVGINDGFLSPSIMKNNECNDNIDSIPRSRSATQLVCTQKSLQGTCSSVPDLVADSDVRSERSSITVSSGNRLYQPPSHRDNHSLFSLKIKNTDQFCVDEAQLQMELRGELLKYFPDKIAKIMVITWNMAFITVYPDLLHGLIGNNNSNEMSDLYLLCFQETTSNKSELLMRIQMSVGGHYVIYSYAENGSLLCVLVGHKKFIWNLALIGKSYLSTRVTPVTKGAAAISFQFFGNTILFLGSHFSSDQGRKSLRIEDYKSILYSKELIKSLTNPEMKLGNDENNLSHYFDYTFWAGDLNFRIVRDNVTIARLIMSELECHDGQAFEELLEFDELINSQAAGFVFQEFEEGRITFLPTYRFIIQTDEYNEKRTPSYTDRILFRSQKCRGIECVYYNSIQSYLYSDHKPVCAVMEINVVPQQSEHLKASGNFNKEIYNKCFDVSESKQSKAASNKPVQNPQSPICSIQ